jgi:hypothetical protein
MVGFTQSQLEALEEAISTGTYQVMYGSKTVTYRSLDEMLKLRDRMKKELGLTKEASSKRYGEFDKGLN